MRPIFLRAVSGIGLLAALASPADAATFTFAPSAAVPTLGGGTFSADTIYYTNSLYAVVQPDTTFVAHRIMDITGFSLNGITVNPIGFGSSYGLYIDDTDLGLSTPTSLRYTGGSIRILADPGNNNGAVTLSNSGIGFANGGPTGTADDVLLASGVELSGTASLDLAAGTRTTRLTDTYAAVASESGFFVAPESLGFIQFVNVSGIVALVNTPGQNGTTIQTFAGATGSAQFVPEPSSAGLLGIAALGLLWRTRRRSARSPSLSTPPQSPGTRASRNAKWSWGSSTCRCSQPSSNCLALVGLGNWHRWAQRPRAAASPFANGVTFLA